MIKTNIEGALSFTNDADFKKAFSKAEEALEHVKKGTGPGSEWLGWRRILAEPNDAMLEKIDRLSSQIRIQADVFIVCGIGGSFMGAKAVIDALTPVFSNRGTEIVFAGHHMGGWYLQQLMEYIKTPKDDGSPKSVYLNVISKSGGTLETALAFRTIRKWMHETYGAEAKDRIIATTGPQGGILNQIIDKEGYTKFVIPDDVGGRYSVLTPVGLLPIAVAGVDIQTFYYGAVNEYQALENSAEELLKYAAVRYIMHERGMAIDVIGTFEPELNSFIGWIQQLMGESEGKEGKGLFPVSAAYSTDLHSFGQLIQQGQRNMMETLLVVDKALTSFTVAEEEDDVDKLNYVAGKKFHEINSHALMGTTQAHIDGGVPVIHIKMEKLNAQQLGGLIYFYELLTAVYVYMLGINPFDQPGVEDYKKAMFKLLGK